MRSLRMRCGAKCSELQSWLSRHDWCQGDGRCGFADCEKTRECKIKWNEYKREHVNCENAYREKLDKINTADGKSLAAGG